MERSCVSFQNTFFFFCGVHVFDVFCSMGLQRFRKVHLGIPVRAWETVLKNAAKSKETEKPIEVRDMERRCVFDSKRAFVLEVTRSPVLSTSVLSSFVCECAAILRHRCKKPRPPLAWLTFPLGISFSAFSKAAAGVVFFFIIIIIIYWWFKLEEGPRFRGRLT